MPTPDLTAARERIAAAYDPAAFAAAGERLIATLSDHLRRVECRDAKALNWSQPADLIRDAEAALGAGDGACDVADRVNELARRCLARGQNLHHPHYVGHQVPPPVPLAALFDLVGSVTNQAMAIYEMGPYATAVEHAIVAAVGEQLGFARGTFAGLITSGGSLANLTALLTARNVVLGDAWMRRAQRPTTRAGDRRARRHSLQYYSLRRHPRSWHRPHPFRRARRAAQYGCQPA